MLNYIASKGYRCYGCRTSFETGFRFGLPIPRRGPLTAVVAFVPAPSGPLAEPTAEQVEAHHARVYGALAAAYDAAKPAMGLPAAATLTIT